MVAFAYLLPNSNDTFFSIKWYRKRYVQHQGLRYGLNIVTQMTASRHFKRCRESCSDGGVRIFGPELK